MALEYFYNIIAAHSTFGLNAGGKQYSFSMIVLCLSTCKQSMHTEKTYGKLDINYYMVNLGNLP